MYRNCKKCCAFNNHMATFNEDAIETKCNNVNNSMNMANWANYEDECMCGFEEEENVFPDNPMLAQSYVPWQTMNKTFTPCVGLKMGTIYPELVSPYVPCQSIEENAFIKAKNEIGKGCNK